MDDPGKILNWRRWNQTITLSGQPTEQELSDLKDLGVTTIINLGPHDNKGALDDEASSVNSLGMNYVYLPVDFDNPSAEDFKQFLAAMAKYKKEHIHVHCIYNARVTAFIYRYATEGYGGTPQEARILLESVWRPGGVWAAFIGDESRVGQAHQYAGDDY